MIRLFTTKIRKQNKKIHVLTIIDHSIVTLPGHQYRYIVRSSVPLHCQVISTVALPGHQYRYIARSSVPLHCQVISTVTLPGHQYRYIARSSVPLHCQVISTVIKTQTSLDTHKTSEEKKPRKKSIQKYKLNWKRKKHKAKQ